MTSFALLKRVFNSENRRYEMKQKLVLFIELSIVLTLLNIVAQLFAKCFIKDYMSYDLSGESFLSSFIIVLLISFFQCFFFSKYLRGVIPSLCLALLFLFLICFDGSGYGSEVVFMTVSFFSRPLYLLSFLIDKISSDCLRTLVWSVTYSFGFGLYLFSLYCLVKLFNRQPAGHIRILRIFAF